MRYTVIICFMIIVYNAVAVNLVLGDSLLIHKNVMDDPYIPRLTKQEMVVRLDRELFDFPTASSLSYFFDNDEFHPVTFATDLGWDRLCYHDRYWEWIKTYGEDEVVAEKNLFGPIDVCSNNGNGPNGGNTAYIFVLEAGKYRNRILRLMYYHPSILLSFDDSLTIDSDMREGYQHICLHDGGTVGNVNDDYLWVIDEYYGKMDKYNCFGAKGIQRTKNYSQGWGTGEFGTYGDIACGRNPGSGESNDYIFVLDGSRQRVVRLYDDGSDLIYDLYYESSNMMGLSGIAVDVYGQVYVTEKYGGKIWKFTPDLQLLGIYDPGGSGPNGLAYPTCLNNALGTPNNPGWADLFVCEDYTDTSGGQWYQIGVKLIGQPNTVLANPYEINISYSASDPHALFAGVYSWSDYLDDWVFVDSICGDTLVKYSGASVLEWSVLNEGISKLYKFQATGQSTYHDDNDVPIDEFNFEVQKTFGNEAPSIWKSLYLDGWEGEDCVTYSNPDHISSFAMVIVQDDSPNLTYHWNCTAGSFVNHFSGVTSLTIVSNQVEWFPPDDGPSAPSHGRITVNADDGNGASVKDTVEFNLDDDCVYNPDPECPTLYVQTDKGFEIDNNVLSASEDAEQKAGFLHDYYLLQQAAVSDEDGYVHLQLAEDEHQTTTFDELKLTVAYVEENREVGISDNGTVFYPREIKTPVSISDGSGSDQLATLTAKDGNSYTSSSPGELIINFGAIGKSALAASALSDGGGPGIPPPAKNMDKSVPVADLASGNILRVDVRDNTGQWVNAGIVPPRKLNAFSYFNLDDRVVPGEDLWVRLRWDYAYSIDHLAYYAFDGSGIELQEFKPAVVSHSSLGDARDALLTENDEMTTTLRPGETIALSFGPIPQAPAGKTIRYVFSCTGRYAIEESGLSADPISTPDSTSLDQNTPNPFNEATTILYTLREGGPVTLEIFNILGQRVTTLVNETQSAGRHRISWDGRDQQGRQTASGIYFYRLTTNDFTASKKMMLMK